MYAYTGECMCILYNYIDKNEPGKMIDKYVRESQSAREGQLANWLSRVLSN